MATGTVKWFSDDKGDTGIAGDGFRSLSDGATVSSDAETGPTGPNAANVQPV